MKYIIFLLLTGCSFKAITSEGIKQTIENTYIAGCTRNGTVSYTEFEHCQLLATEYYERFLVGGE